MHSSCRNGLLFGCCMVDCQYHFARCIFVSFGICSLYFAFAKCVLCVYVYFVVCICYPCVCVLCCFLAVLAVAPPQKNGKTIETQTSSRTKLQNQQKQKYSLLDSGQLIREEWLFPLHGQANQRGVTLSVGGFSLK